ncbi:hypothetical protein KVT40_004484 [Elsinoe batatas]|uniref:Rhodopsin domain-containing protein n=1 Tax=Elsinoe batatas TaxID=2601811 RepID=A0A8K0L6I3_9PEZI|nr:hypothetical protein KVT40_004484 [Elsinoe batatas]
MSQVYAHSIILSSSIPTLPTLKSFLFWNFTIILQYSSALAFIKFSILFQYRAMFPPSTFQVWLKILFVIITLYFVGVAIAGSLIICKPLSYFWTRPDPTTTGSCLSPLPVFITYTALDMVTTLLILLLPVPVLTKMHLPLRQRFWLVVLFTVGGSFELAVSVVRVVIFLRPDAQGHLFTVKSNLVAMAVCSSSEVAVGIICSCIPALKPLIVKVFPAFASSGSRDTGDNVHGMTLEIPDQRLGKEAIGEVNTLETMETAQSKKRGKDSEGAISLQGIVGRVDDFDVNRVAENPRGMVRSND